MRPSESDYETWFSEAQGLCGLTATFNDRQYFQDLREAAKDSQMVAYYEHLLRRYD
jgi:hypothetical protein